MCRALPERRFVPVLLLAKMPSVIGPEDQNRVVAIFAVVERIDHLADHGICKRDGSQIGPHGFTPLAFGYDAVVLFFANGREFLAHGGNIVEVVLGSDRDTDILLRVHVEVRLRSEQRDMRMPESDGEEEGFVMLFFKEAAAESTAFMSP